MFWFDSPEYLRGMATVRSYSDEVWNETKQAKALTSRSFSENTAANAFVHMGIAVQTLISLQQLCPAFIQPHDLNELRELIINTQLELSSWALSCMLE